MIRFLIAGAIWLFFLCTGQAQSKWERESRIKRSEVPTIAVDFIKQIKKYKKLKWYREVSQDGTSYEAKMTIADYDYSIEFDSTGVLLDVERIISRSAKEDHTQLILKTIESDYSLVRLYKIQEQYKADEKTLIKLINSNTLSQSLVCLYEVEFAALHKDAYRFYEVLINQNGNILKTSEIIDRTILNMEF